MSIKPIDQWIGSQVRSRRERLGLTLRELSEETGFGVSTLAAFESGTLRVGAARLLALAKALDVGALYFFGEEPGKLFATLGKGASDRRLHARFAAEGAVEIRSGSVVRPVSVLDISCSGLSVAGLEGHDVGSRVRVAHSNFICQGRVVWTAEDRGGLCFDVPLPFDALGALIREHALM